MVRYILIFPILSILFLNLTEQFGRKKQLDFIKTRKLMALKMEEGKWQRIYKSRNMEK